MLAQKQQTDPSPLKNTSVFHKINYLLSDKTLSPSEFKVMVGMITACGTSGTILYSVKIFAKRIRMSESRTRHLLCQLVGRGYLIRVERPHLANEWRIPALFPDQANELEFISENSKIQADDNNKQVEYTVLKMTCRDVKNDTPLLKNISNKQNVKNVLNFSENQNVKTKTDVDLDNIHDNQVTNPKPFDINLVREIEKLVGTTKDRGCWLKIVRSCSRDIVCAAISSLRIAMNEGIVNRPGGYFVQTIKNHYPEVFCSSKTSSVTMSSEDKRIITHLKSATEPVVDIKNQPASPEIALNSIRRIKMMLNDKAPSFKIKKELVSCG